MKSSLIAAAVLSTIVLSVQARASETPPPNAPIQIIQSGKVVAQLNAAPEKASVGKASVLTGDAAAAAKEKQAEADFKASKPSQNQVVKPAVVVAAPPTPVAPKASIAVRAPIAVVQPLMKPAVHASHIIANSAQLPSAQPRVSKAHPMDGASLWAARCSMFKRHSLKCMNLELSRAETELDSVEVKLLNCAQLRKFDGEVANATIDAFVTGRMYQLRFKATQSFNAEMASALEGHSFVKRMKTHEIELRATLNHLNAAESLASKVCSAPKFKALYNSAMADAASN
jgi:hypothetical protein